MYLCSDQNWNTPVLVDLKEGAVSVIVQAEKYVVRFSFQHIHNANHRWEECH